MLHDLAHQVSVCPTTRGDAQEGPASQVSQGVPLADPQKRGAAALLEPGPASKRQVIILRELQPVDPQRYRSDHH
jgi:hypothetical protein